MGQVTAHARGRVVCAAPNAAACQQSADVHVRRGGAWQWSRERRARAQAWDTTAFGPAVVLPGAPMVDFAPAAPPVLVPVETALGSPGVVAGVVLWVDVEAGAAAAVTAEEVVAAVAVVAVVSVVSVTVVVVVVVVPRHKKNTYAHVSGRQSPIGATRHVHVVVAAPGLSEAAQSACCSTRSSWHVCSRVHHTRSSRGGSRH